MKVNPIQEISCIMVRAIKSRVLVVTRDEKTAEDLSIALLDWCKDKGVKCNSYFQEYTYHIPGYCGLTFISAMQFNKQNRRHFAGEVYVKGQGIITTLEMPPMPIESIYRSDVQ